MSIDVILVLWLCYGVEVRMAKLLGRLHLSKFVSQNESSRLAALSALKVEQAIRWAVGFLVLKNLFVNYGGK